MHTFRFYIGTHASAGQDSLCLCEADFSAGTFSTLRAMRDLSDPTYLALSPQKVLYALSRSGSKGSVNAIREHAIVSTLPSGGSGPCHICVDDRGEFLLCANYGSGSVSLYDLNSDGKLCSLCDHRQYSGIGFDSADRQKGPHAHFAAFYSGGLFPDARDQVLVCDLGLDMVYVYELDRTARKLRDTGRSIRLPDGTGPRHLAFSDRHPGMLFVLTEMANTIFTYRFDPANGKYRLVQEISAVSGAASDEALMQPSTADNGSIGCAIRFTKDGKYLFVSSRLGYQSISAFRCDPDGRLIFVDRCLCGGITPRDFHLFEIAGPVDQDVRLLENADPEDQDVRLLVANQDSDLITALQFDRHSETLSLLEMNMQAVRPTCILPV